MTVAAFLPAPYAEVAVDAPAALRGVFTYALPLGMTIEEKDKAFPKEEEEQNGEG